VPHSLDHRAVAHTHDEIDQVAKTIAASVEAMTPSRATLARRVAWSLTDLGSRRTGGHARSGDRGGPAVYEGTFKDACVMDWRTGRRGRRRWRSLHGCKWPAWPAKKRRGVRLIPAMVGAAIFAGCVAWAEVV
jgi:hypothetical protein